MKPGESKTFTFSFISDKVGMFNEEYELLTEPLLNNSLPMLSLSGIATQEDEYAEKRQRFWEDFTDNFVQKDAAEAVETIIDRVKTPPKAEPNRRDAAVFAKMFEENNQDLKLYYSADTMDGFYDLLSDIEILYNKQDLQIPEDFEWSTKVGELEKMIEKIANPYTRQTMLDRFIKLVSKARKTPNDRAHSFNVIKSLVGKIAEQVVDIETKVRDEVGGVPLEQFRGPEEDETEEQR